MALPAKVRISNMQRRARERIASTRTDVAVGGLGTAAAMGAFADKLPETLGPIPTRVGLGVGAMYLGLKGNGYALGAAIALLSPYIEDTSSGLLGE